MKFSRIGFAALAASLLATSAMATSGTLTIKDGNGTTQTVTGVVNGGNFTPGQVPSDASGNPYSAANGMFVNPATGAVFPVSGSVSITGVVSIADSGVPITGQTIPAGGSGIIGWLSAILAGLNAPIPAGGNTIGNVTQIGAAAISTGQASCGTSATQIVAARTGAAGTGRAAVTITNTTTTPIFVGGSSVTTSNGALLPGIVGASLTLNDTAAVYCAVATGTATVTEIETY